MLRNPVIVLTVLLVLSACSTMEGQAPVALALENQDQPFQSGIEIAKPTSTPTPTLPADSLSSPVPPTPALPPAETATPAVFSDDAFVVIENLPPPRQDTTQNYSAPTTSGYGGSKYILVDISEQHMYVYEGDVLVYSFVASTGMKNATRTGTFSVLNKIPNAYGATWNIWMPNWLGIYWAGSLQNGIHALPILPSGATLWAGYLGTPISYGCVVLGSYESQLLYNWAEVGTPVEIRW